MDYGQWTMDYGHVVNPPWISFLARIIVKTVYKNFEFILLLYIEKIRCNKWKSSSQKIHTSGRGQFLLLKRRRLEYEILNSKMTPLIKNQHLNYRRLLHVPIF